MSHLNNAPSDILANILKEARKSTLSHLFLQTYFCTFNSATTGSWQYLLIKIIIIHVDHVGAFNITKTIRWIISSLIVHVILMMSQKDKCFLSQKNANLPFYR